MGLFDSIKDKTKKMLNGNFLNAVVAGCTLVAYADGSVSAEEKDKTLGAIQRNADLSCFTPAEIQEKFNKYADHLEFDFNLGKQHCLEDLRKIKTNTKDSEMCIAIMCSVARADANFDRDEKNVVLEICRELGVQPNKHGL